MPYFGVLPIRGYPTQITEFPDDTAARVWAMNEGNDADGYFVGFPIVVGADSRQDCLVKLRLDFPELGV